MRRKIVGVIGGHSCTKEVERLAHNLGKKLSKVVCTLVCGGLGGVMLSVCRGFKAKSNLTIGITTSYNKNDANKFVDIVIPTGMGLARNILVVNTADIVVALPGASGTLSEISYCLQLGIPVISLNSWDIKGVIKVSNIEAALKEVKNRLR